MTGGRESGVGKEGWHHRVFGVCERRTSGATARTMGAARLGDKGG